MTSNHYDVARMANTMGMKTTIVLDPTQITVRVKNSVKRQLRQGRITGGWKSHAARIAEHLTQTQELNVTRDTWQGVKIAKASMDTKRMLLEIVQADWAATMLEDSRNYNVPYYKSRVEQAQINLTRPDTKDFYLGFFHKEFAEKARNLMSQTLTAADRERIEKALDLLDATDPIHIVTYQ